MSEAPENEKGDLEDRPVDKLEARQEDGRVEVGAGETARAAEAQPAETWQPDTSPLLSTFAVFENPRPEVAAETRTE
ncbi:MAG: hypothetical protein ABSE87_06665, partial [Terracidiphilus sp.]